MKRKKKKEKEDSSSLLTATVIHTEEENKKINRQTSNDGAKRHIAEENTATSGERRESHMHKHARMQHFDPFIEPSAHHS